MSTLIRRTRLLVSCLFVLAAALALPLSQVGAAQQGEKVVYVLTTDGVVNPVMDRYVDRGIGRAEDAGAAAVVIRLDTPGGLISSMEEIVKRIERSEVPVIVYVWPSGGRAASAGAFITMASHLAAMAPGTRIGAATPVGAGGEDIEGDLGDKVTNDAVALIRGLAELRGRNADWAEDAVREAVSSTSTEAVELNVVELIAQDLEDLLAQADGRTVRVGIRDVTIDVDGAEIVFNDMNFFEKFLDFLADPNITVILLSLGFLGILIELSNPGIILPGVAGALSLLLAFFSLGTIPYNEFGLALILLAMALFLLEVFVTSGGILAGGGVIALVIGGFIFMADNPPEFQPNRALLIGLGAALSAMFLTLTIGVARSRQQPAAVGAEALTGQLATVRTPLAPSGYVFLVGERWQATLEEGTAQPGDTVRVVGVEGLKLIVRKDGQAPAG